MRHIPQLSIANQLRGRVQRNQILIEVRFWVKTRDKFLLSALYHALFDLNLETGSIVQIQRELQRQYLEVLLRTFSSYFDGIVTKVRISNYITFSN